MKVIKDKFDLFVVARWAYGLGKEIISDEEYNRLYVELEPFHNNEPYFHQSWSSDPCPIDLLEKYDAMELVAAFNYTDKTSSMDSLRNETQVKEHFESLKIMSRLAYKIDGWCTQADYFLGKRVAVQTRGRVGNSLDMSGCGDMIPLTIPEKRRVRIYMETSIPNALWKKFALESTNISQRHSVSTAVAQGLWEYLKPLAFGFDCEEPMKYPDKYQTLKEWGFATPLYMMVSNYTGLMTAIKMMGSRRATYGFRTDGLVLENPKIQVAIRVGEYLEQLLESYVTGYEEKRGSYGDTMIARIQTVYLESSTHDRVTVTNLECIKEYNLRVGSPIAFNLRSDAYPTLDKSRTLDLHSQWEGRFEEFCERIDEKQEAERLKRNKV